MDADTNKVNSSVASADSTEDKLNTVEARIDCQQSTMCAEDDKA